MAKKSRVQLDLYVQTKEAIKGINKLNREVTLLGNNIQKAFQTSSILGWGKALVNITKQMIKASEAESSYIESMNLLEVSYKNNTASAEELMNTLKNFYGLDPAGLTKQLAVYKQMTSAMGFANETSALLSENLLKMQEDVSSLYNLDFEVVGSKFQSALAGQTRAVRDLGVDITMASLQQELYARGIDKSINDMNRATKTALIYLTMERQLANAQGDAARTINSVANQTRIFGEQTAIAARQIGALFIPVLKTVLPLLNGILMALNAIGEFLLGLFGIDAKKLASEFGISTVSTDLDNVGTSAGNAGKAVDKLYGKLRSFDKLNVITTPTDKKSGGGLAGGIGGIDKDVLNSIKDYNNQLEQAKNKAKEIRDAILGWLGFTVDENGQIKSFHLTLGSIVGMLAVGSILWKGIKGILGLLKGIEGLLGIKGGIFTGLTGISKIFTGKLSPTTLDLMGKKFLKLGVSIGGAFFGVHGITDAYKAANELAKGNIKASDSALLLAGSVGQAALGGALLGSNFGLAGAAIGGVVGTIGGLISALIGYNSEMDKIAKSEVYGNILITTEEWANDLSKLNPELNKMYEIIQTHNTTMEGLATNFTTAYDELDKYTYRFGFLSQKISTEDGPAILNSIKDTFTNSSKIIDEETTFAVNTFTDMWRNGSELSKEEQTNILNNIVNYGASQKEELKNAQDTITKIYDKAVKERRGLTEQEYNQVKDALDKIRILTTTQVGENEAKLIKMQQEFGNTSHKLSEESYKNLKAALDGYNKDVENKAWTNYVNRLDQIEKFHKLNKIKDDEYKKLQKEAQEDYNKEITEGQKKAQEYQNKILDELAKRYQTASEDAKREIEGIFRDLNINPTDMIKQFEKAGTQCYGAFNDAMRRGLQTSYDVKINPILNGKYSVGTTGSGGNNYLEIKKVKADGGFVNTGEAFIAREAGPELVGRIGSKTAVANNDQIVNSIAKGLAMSGIGRDTNVNIIAKGDTAGLMDFITFEQQKRQRQYGL